MSPRLLLVHAHPDDESIGNGVTMAAAVAAGARVTLVTCTLGEEGEVIPPGQAHLAADREDALGPYRERELTAAMRALGVRDHRLLGGAGRWRDSGMMGLATNRAPNAFWGADPDLAGRQLADIIEDVRPHVLITYDPQGGYGHPDHIQAHRVALRGAELAAPRHRIARVLYNCLPATEAGRRLSALTDTARAAEPVAALGDLPGVVPDASVAVTVHGTAADAAAKQRAMAAHATQIRVREDGTSFALSNDLVQPLWETEYYTLAAGVPVPDGATDVFAGLDLEESR
ncbi:MULTISPECIES: N-acetyl-1-D-myo-inositol-2-amino-2-deoxy-alpha-D-glucopyranoside deacetylase [Streptomyces]|uniref:1D-myo-inositol 2-acetamido-2-deoxy-alpha-D-glucopyranoside deacetylase n=2 Tax=Streptomyces TaxID=1883 RepID=A0A1I6TZV2_9ACTN|nr:MULTISPECIES: N-acetyl-1-D-myo-inositol-2-amino-2-deoxy-alpha-D-glucopyranoside deacetylase [Streptomyces]QKV70509.1 N-acetyl-1-D-myo-inositol-2-amino-2-deoxy-alpha-D-glucopyranoside deacetylase [Streptomyces harbinensis]SFS94769.1 N-acetyl-1-D-myo-inositol-2-amino-2-deoxy-alpha-D-glucopyranoside deacetylase [Streptomyces harbinensis]